jgi:pimeloyl-ACP methyl ester carboxylesterase
MQHAYADINGIRMHYVTHGSGEPLLLLHGFPEYWGIWKHLMPELAKTHRVIAPDLRGYHLTSRPKDVEAYRIENLVGDVRALVEHLGLSKVTVMAQDWGALLGWSFVLRHPELIRRYVTVNITHPALFNRDLRENPKQQQASQYMLAFRTPGFEQQMAANDFAFARQDIFEDARKHGASISAEDEAEWLQILRQPGALEAALNYYRATKIGPPDGQGAPGGSTLLDGLSQEQWKTRFPVLVLWGEEDPYLMPSGLEGLEQLVPDLTVHKLPGATHWVTLEKPAEVLRHLRDFIAQKN